MERKQRGIAESLIRAMAFLDAHPEPLGVLRDTPAYQELAEAVRDVARHTATQSDSRLHEAAYAERRRQVEREIRKRYMAPIAAFSRVKLRGVPDFAALTRNGRDLSGRGLVDAARSMATAATPVADRFTEAKFPETFIPDLARLADDLERVLNDRSSGNGRRTEATKGISVALANGRKAVSMLDPIVTRMLGSSEAATAWRRAKRVHLSTTVRYGGDVTPGAVEDAA